MQSRVRRYITNAPAIGVLVFSWCVCFFWIMVISTSPWDTTPVRPPVSHWQRTVSDFFESGPGPYSVAAVFVAASGLSYAWTLARSRSVMITSLLFGITNIAGLIILTAIGILIRQFIRVPSHPTPEDWLYWGDYSRDWFLNLVTVVGYASLPMVQSHLARRLTRALSSAGSEAASKPFNRKVVFVCTLLVLLSLLVVCGTAMLPPVFFF